MNRGISLFVCAKPGSASTSAPNGLFRAESAKRDLPAQSLPLPITAICPVPRWSWARVFADLVWFTGKATPISELGGRRKATQGRRQKPFAPNVLISLW